MRYLAILLLTICLATSLSACGKKGEPEAPGESTYPNTYPAPVE